jgi:hypothetical protein
MPAPLVARLPLPPVTSQQETLQGTPKGPESTGLGEAGRSFEPVDRAVVRGRLRCVMVALAALRAH